MAKKITELAAETAPATTDLLTIVDDPSGTPTTKKITLSDHLKVINGLTADASPDGAADYVATYDASAGGPKKVLLNNLPAGSFTVAGDSGGGQAISNGDTLTIAGGTGLVSADSATDTVTLNLDVNSLTADATPDGAADYVATYDADAGTHKKVLLNNLPVGVDTTGTPANNQVAVFTDADTIEGTTTLTFDGTTFTLGAAGTYTTPTTPLLNAGGMKQYCNRQEITDLSTTPVSLFSGSSIFGSMQWFIENVDSDSASLQIFSGIENGVTHRYFAQASGGNCSISESPDGTFAITGLGDGRTYTLTFNAGGNSSVTITASSTATGTTTVGVVGWSL